MVLFPEQYYLKAKFHFNKDQFADLMVISGIAGTVSQVSSIPYMSYLSLLSNFQILGSLISGKLCSYWSCLPWSQCWERRDCSR